LLTAILPCVQKKPRETTIPKKNHRNTFYILIQLFRGQNKSKINPKILLISVILINIVAFLFFFFATVEARKQFKTFVNILSTIKNENNEKYLILRKKYVNEAPPEDLVHNSSAPMSPDARSVTSDGEQSPFRPNQPPPYRHPPEFSPSFGTPPPPVTKAPVLPNPQYKECVDEFKVALTVLEGRMKPQTSVDSQSSGNSRKSSVDIADTEPPPPVLPPRRDRQLSRENSSNNNSEKIDAIQESVVIEKSESVVEDNKENDSQDNNDNKISVKEATRKFNRYASVEEAKVPSPLGKKKPDKVSAVFY
jgi:hypothetical protein